MNISPKAVVLAVVALIAAAPFAAYAYGESSGGVVIPIFMNTPTPTPSATPVVAPSGQSYSETALPGDGVSNLALRALDAYLADHPGVQLNADRRFYVIDHMWRAALIQLDPGTVVTFSVADIERFIAQSVGFVNVSVDELGAPIDFPVVTPAPSVSPAGEGSTGQEANITDALGDDSGFLSRFFGWFKDLLF